MQYVKIYNVQKPLSTTSYALLGLLRLRPWGTYELAQQAKRSLHWFWPRAERKLYEEPKLLAAHGLATATQESHGNRPRTVYAITDEGRAELARWLSEPAEPRTADFAEMLKVFFADAGTLAQLEDTLTRLETEARERAGSLTTMARETQARARFPERVHVSILALRLHLIQEIEILRWVEWVREQIACWNTVGDPGAWSTEDVLRDTIALGEAWQ